MTFLPLLFFGSKLWILVLCICIFQLCQFYPIHFSSIKVWMLKYLCFNVCHSLLARWPLGCSIFAAYDMLSVWYLSLILTGTGQFRIANSFRSSISGSPVAWMTDFFSLVSFQWKTWKQLLNGSVCVNLHEVVFRSQTWRTIKYSL